MLAVWVGGVVLVLTSDSKTEFRKWWSHFSDPIKKAIQGHSYGETGNKRKRYAPGKEPTFDRELVEALLVLEGGAYQRRLQPFVLEAVGEVRGIELARRLWRLLATGELHEKQTMLLAHDVTDQLLECLKRVGQFPPAVGAEERENGWGGDGSAADV